MNKTTLNDFLRRWWPLLLIIFFAIGIRFYKLGQIPIELNRDEASLGYTAYSLLKSGKDEHGVPWPINIESFGDWKLPSYVYTLVPFIYLFGLENWVVRLPSALAGVGIVILSALITWQISAGWLDNKRRHALTLLVPLMLTISPWQIHLAHVAYEANLALFFFMTGMVLFLHAMSLNPKKTRGVSQAFLPLSTIFFGLTFFTYHSYQIFTPIMALGLFAIFRPKINSIWQKNRNLILISTAIATAFTIGLISTSISANQTKFSGLSIFDASAYSDEVGKNRSYFSKRNSILAKIHTNTFSLFVNQVQHNLLAPFSAQFLFFEGGTNKNHNISGLGNLYPINLILLIIAGLVFVRSYQDKKFRPGHKLILLWLLAASIAPVITFESAHSIRFSSAVFPLEFLAGFGLLTLFYDRRKFVRLIFIFISLSLFYSLIYFLLTYFIVSPKRDIDNHNWQMQQIVQMVGAKYDEYDLIIFPGTQWSPYIYFLYYNQTNPDVARQQLIYFPIDDEGFKHVERLDKISFELATWREDPDKRILYVLKREEIPGDKFEKEGYKIEQTLTNQWAKAEWILLSRTPDTQ